MKKIKISSSKGYFGNNLGAAAAIEFVTTALMIHKGCYPATLNFSQKREDCRPFDIIVNKKYKFSKEPKLFVINNSAYWFYQLLRH